MDKPGKNILAVGLWVLSLLVFWQIINTPGVRSFFRAVITPEVAENILSLGTGRQPVPTEAPQPEETAAPTQPPPETVPVGFQPEDAEILEFSNYADVTVLAQDWLLAPLSWNLQGSDGPTVLIYHSHATESYENTENYDATVPYRTLQTQYNMISIGERLAQKLEAAGIQVIHDKTLHDYPSYTEAYYRSEDTVERYLKTYPTIRLVLDIHRDAYEDSQGNQMSATVTVDGLESSRLMLVVGTNEGSASHPNWQENAALAVKLQAVLSQLHPQLCRAVCLRSSTFNQYLSPGALLIEVGTAGDTRQQALYGAELLAEGIIKLSYGSIS